MKPNCPAGKLQSVALRDDLHHSLFRCRQFILGPQYAPGLDDWRHLIIGPGLKLTAHPELIVTQSTSGSKTLTALGFMLDPYNPEVGDQVILDRLLDEIDSREQLIRATSSLGGRWIIIGLNEREKFLFSDAFGLRQVFYTSPEVVDDLYVMSEPSIGATMLSLPVDDKARAYMDSKTFRTDPEYFWPAASSPFQGINRLLPNHWLDLDAGLCKRFWPARGLDSVTLEAATEKIAYLLTGLLRAAANRFDLAIAITAGIDSRVVLAACNEIRNKVLFVTLRQWHMDDNNADITIPRRLMAQLDLQHDVIYSQSPMTPEFSHLFKSSIYQAHEHYGPDAEAVLKRFQRSKVAVTGSGGEVGRCPFREELPFFDSKRVSGAYLSRMKLGEQNEFARMHFINWLNDAGAGYGINLMDLFEWEHECGSWLAAVQLEFDIAWKEIFTPFNCRDIAIAMLSVPKRYRKGPKYPLFRNLIEKLWAETLGVPINPHRMRSRMEQYFHETQLILKHILHRIRSY